jgi:CRISPR system Cascade subunit CasE
MQLSRLILNPRSRAVRRDLGDCNGMHRTLLRCFPAATGPARQEHGVLYRIESVLSAVPQVLVQSRAVPEWTLLPAGYLADIEGNPSVKSIDHFLENVPDQARYRFRLVANPTRDISVPQPDGTKKEMRVELRNEEDWYQWLNRKSGQHGFRVLRHDVRPEVMNAAAAAPGKWTGRKNGTLITVAPVRFDGILEITDGTRFRETLLSGIGRSRAYGCGLLSVARLG